MIKNITYMMFLLLVACSSSYKNSYYALTSIAPIVSVDKQFKSTKTVAITSLTLPELVDRPHLVIVKNGNSVDILEFNRWAESLKSSIPHIMADNLSRQLGIDLVSAYPQVAAMNAAVQLSIDFQTFTATESTVSVDVLWTIKGHTKIPETYRTRVTDKYSGNYELLADAYSRALAVVCADIAKKLVAGNYL